MKDQLRPAYLSAAFIEEHPEYENVHVYRNKTYQVLVRGGILSTGFLDLPVTHLSIRRMDQEPIHDWRDLQEIKTQLCGENSEAVELYPAEDRVVDKANQYHLYVLAPGLRFSIGMKQGRQVQYDSCPDGQYKQRKKE